MVRLVDEGAKMPKFYGVAYRDFAGSVLVCYPVPLNLVVRWWIHLWAWMRIPSSSYLERMLGSAYAEGMRYGRLIGYRRGYKQKQKDIRKQLDKIDSPRD